MINRICGWWVNTDGLSVGCLSYVGEGDVVGNVEVLLMKYIARFQSDDKCHPFLRSYFV